MAVAASRIDNRVLMPGESLSASSAFLPRTKANGYKMAGVYLNGVHTLGMGGGVCQVSSDLYRAHRHGTLAAQHAGAVRGSGHGRRHRTGL